MFWCHTFYSKSLFKEVAVILATACSNVTLSFKLIIRQASILIIKTEKTSELRRRVYANFSPEEFEKLKERSFRTPPPPRLPRKPCARPSTSRQQEVEHGTEIPPWNGPADSNYHDNDTYQIPISFSLFQFFLQFCDVAEIVIIHNLI